MRKTMVVLLSLSAMALSGCATTAAVGPMSYNYIPKTTPKNSALVNAISVNQVTGGHETNPLWTSQISDENFSAALVQSLQSANLYHKFPGSSYSLNAELLKLSQPLMGLNLKVTCAVHYTVKAVKTSKVVFDQTITTSYTAGFSDSAIAATRLKIANEGAARMNIQQFIQALYQLPKS